MARVLVKLDAGNVADHIAQEMFDMAEGVIGQQMPPLFSEPEPEGFIMDNFKDRFPTAVRIRVGEDVTKLPPRDYTVIFPGNREPVQQENYDDDFDRIG